LISFTTKIPEHSRNQNEKSRIHHEGTKDTKGSDLDIFKVLNFVLFVAFVVKVVFSFWLRLSRAVSFVVNTLSH